MLVVVQHTGFAIDYCRNGHNPAYWTGLADKVRAVADTTCWGDD
jgi:hypothetical protein